MAQPDSTYVLYNRQTGSYEVPVTEEIISSRNQTFLYLNTRTNHIIPLSRRKGKTLCGNFIKQDYHGQNRDKMCGNVAKYIFLNVNVK
jgi:hypothetical protein